jgi:tetratricopeptide (TPR) repeat protein
VPRDLELLQPGRQDYIELDTGLGTPHAQNLLRSMDRDGRVGLRDSPEEVLDSIRERTLGIPRALEAFFAVLRADRFTSVDELLRADDVPENVVEALVAEAFSRLDQHARAVVQALAVFNRPVPAEAVEFLLPVAYSTGSTEAVLRRLATMYLVRHDQGRYYLHPVDRAYALSQLEPGAPGDWAERREGESQTLATLRYLGAEYFRAHSPAEIGSSEDLEPGLVEFELRLASGDMLQLTGEVFEQADEPEKARLLALTGFALSRLGQEGPAVQRLRAAIDRAGDAIALEEMASWRLQLAACLHVLRELDAAVDELNGVLEVEEIGADAEASALLMLAQIALTQGRYAEAELLQRRALAAAMRAAPWASLSDTAEPEPTVEERLGTIDLYNPQAWTIVVGEFTASGEEGDDTHTFTGLACTVDARVEGGPAAELLVTDTLIGDVWFDRASLALATGDLPASEEACQLAGAMYEQLGSLRTPRAIQLLNDIQAELGRPDEQLLAQEQYLAEARERRIIPMEAQQLRLLGNGYLARDQLQEAEQAFRELEQLGRQERDQDLVVEADLGLARVAWVRDETDAAIDRLERLLGSLADDKIEYRANALSLLGDIERSLYHYDRAIKLFGRARSLFAELGDWQPMITTDQSLAEIELETRDYTSALRRLEGIAPLARRIGVPSVTASVLAGLLDARFRAGDRDGATTVAEEAAQLAASVHLPALIADLEAAAGSMWAELEDYEAAIAAHDRARTIYHDLGRVRNEVVQLTALGYIYGEAERYEEELAVTSQAAELAAGVSDPSQLRYARSWLSIALADVGRYDEAIAIVDPLVQETRDPTTLGNLGWALFVAGRYERSLELSRQAMEVDPHNTELMRNIAHALLALGRPDEAEAHYRSVIEGRRGGEHFRRTIREVRHLLERHPDLARGNEMLELLEQAQAELGGPEPEGPAGTPTGSTA